MPAPWHRRGWHWSSTLALFWLGHRHCPPPGREIMGVASRDELEPLVPQTRQAGPSPLVAEIHGWFTEGFDTSDFRDRQCLVGGAVTGVSWGSHRRHRYQAPGKKVSGRQGMRLAA